MAAFQVPLLPEAGLARSFRSLMARSGLPEDHVERYAARFDSRHALSGPIGWYRAMPLSRLPAHRVRVPTTYVWGSRDFALGRHAAELTAEHVTGPYEFVELRAGHWLPEKHADECAAAIIARVSSV
jgi:pimeloyl-ACP methyl ester carboxylesterase